MINRWALRLRGLMKLLSFGAILSIAVFVYHKIVDLYRVRFFVTPHADNLSSEQVSVYSLDGTTNPVLVSIDCRPDKLTDIRFRPILETSREWSLREMIPGILDNKAVLTSDFPKTIEELADRHMVGGLADWESLEDSSLRSRVRALLKEKQWRLSAGERTSLEDAFLDLPNRHDTMSLGFPATMKAADLSRMRVALDRIQQGWEKDVNTVSTELVLRWQSLTGTNLIASLSGVGGETPVFLSLPPMKSKSGAVVDVAEETGLELETQFDVSAGDEDVYRSGSYEELKMPAYKLAFLNYPRSVVVMFLLLGIIAWSGIYLWRWPKTLNDAELFKVAQKDDSDEVWEELRKREPWVDRYVTEQFLHARPARVPTQDVLTAFWRMIREAFRARPVAARTSRQVERAIFDVLDKALFNALR
jgi:hypothetical protein